MSFSTPRWTHFAFLALAFVAFLILMLVETAALVGRGETQVISAADPTANPVQNTPAAAVVAAQSSVDDPPTDLSASAVEVVSGPPPKIIASFEPSPFIPADESAAEKPAATPPKDDRPVPPGTALDGRENAGAAHADSRSVAPAARRCDDSPHRAGVARRASDAQDHREPAGFAGPRAAAEIEPGVATGRF